MGDRVAQMIAYATRTGKCPICNTRPRARWKDTGDLRITCGHPDCYAKWLPGKRETESDPLNPLFHEQE